MHLPLKRYVEYHSIITDEIDCKYLAHDYYEGKKENPNLDLTLFVYNYCKYNEVNASIENIEEIKKAMKEWLKIIEEEVE